MSQHRDDNYSHGLRLDNPERVSMKSTGRARLESCRHVTRRGGTDRVSQGRSTPGGRREPRRDWGSRSSALQSRPSWTLHTHNPLQRLHCKEDKIPLHAQGQPLACPPETLDHPHLPHRWCCLAVSPAPSQLLAHCLPLRRQRCFFPRTSRASQGLLSGPSLVSKEWVLVIHSITVYEPLTMPRMVLGTVDTPVIRTNVNQRVQHPMTLPTLRPFG